MTRALGGSLDELAGIEREEPEKPQDGSSDVRYGRDETYEDKLAAIYRKSLDGKNRWILLLFIILMTMLVGVIAVLIYDFRNLDVGYIRRQMAINTCKTEAGVQTAASAMWRMDHTLIKAALRAA